jgi:6-phosphogluconolactonase
MNDDLDLTLYADAAELVEIATAEAMELIATNLLEKGVSHIALTGGTLGGQFASRLIERINTAADLTGLHIWFSDERFDSVDSSARNSRPVHDGLKNDTVTVHEVNSSDDGSTVQTAAISYENELRDVIMDICVLGLGPDGHVASLFPNHWNQNATGKAIAIVDSPKPPSERVSFTMPFINSSRQVWIIAAGEAKATAVTRVLEADPAVPAGHVMAAELTRLIADTEAFFTE